jgi:hypothetical protein
LSLLAGQLALRAALGALDSHRLAFDSQVGRRDAPAAIDQRELERLSVGEVGETRLLDRRDVDEHVLAAVIANDEAEALLRVEEFDDALALANDLRRHPATAATAKTAAATAAAATEATASAAAAVAATAATIAAATAAAAITEAAAKSRAVTKAAAVESATETLVAATTETVALITTATTAVTLTPSIETHAEIQTLKCPKSKNQRAGPMAQPAARAETFSAHRASPYRKIGGSPSDSMVKGNL